MRIVSGWDEACERAGLPPADDPRFAERRAPLWRAHQRGELPTERYCEQVAPLSSGRYTPSEVVRVLDAWMIEQYPGVGEVVARVEAAGAIPAVLSNTNPRHWDQLTSAEGLQRHFPVLGRIGQRHASHLLGAVKPEPAIYAAFEQATGYTPAALLFFDDLPANVEGARGAGWSAERIDPAGDTAAQMLGALDRYGIASAARG